MGELIDPRETAGQRYGGDEWTDYIIEQNRYKLIELINAGRLSPNGLDQNVIDKALSARNGHKNVLIAGVIRNDGSGWDLLPISTNHRPVNIDSIETITDPDGVNGFIRVHYESLGAATTVVFVAVQDETLVSHGIIPGTSVTEGHTDIRLSQAARMASDYVSWDGTQWVSQDGVFSSFAFDSSTGKLACTHGAVTIPQSAQYAVSIEPRTDKFKFQIAETSSPFATNRIDIQIRDNSPEIEGYVYYDTNTSAWVLPTAFSAASFASGVLTLTHASIPSADAQKVTLTGRGPAMPRVSVQGSPLTSTQAKIEFYNSAGNLITTPDGTMKVYVRRGGTSRPLVTAPTTDMKFVLNHGGGLRRVHPSAINTLVYPSSNFWLLGFMELPD